MIVIFKVNYIAQTITQSPAYLMWIISASKHTGGGTINCDVIVGVVKSGARNWISVVLAYCIVTVNFSLPGHWRCVDELF